jgi:peptidoglycan/LPS O-acetylase OafA/YrhL
MSPARIALLDALRGMAALTVAWHHLTVTFPFLMAGRERSMLPAVGAFISSQNVEAVLLFFVLSGLSIRLSVRELDMRDPGHVRTYLLRRARRIVPLYLVALGVSGLVGLTLAPASPSSLSAWTLTGNLLYLQTSADAHGNWFEPFAQNDPLWSLSYEVSYYLAFPLVARLGDRRARLLVAGVATVAGMVMLQILPNPIASFAASFFVWYLGVELAEVLLTQSTSVPWWSFSLLALLVLGVLGWRDSATLSALLTGLAFFHAGYLLTRAGQRGWRLPPGTERALIGPLAWVGSFSYGLYLLHYPVLRAAAATSPDTAGVALGALCACVLAYAAERSTRSLVNTPTSAMSTRHARPR